MIRETTKRGKQINIVLRLKKLVMKRKLNRHLFVSAVYSKVEDIV